MTLDLVIVGAGIAGLAAAKAAQAAGLAFAAIEAKPRIGGRAYTVGDLGTPVDLGCHWLHSASLNPFVEIAEAHGFEARPRTVDRQVWLGERWATAAERAARNAFYARNFDAIAAAGAAGRDVPLADLIEQGSVWSPLFRQWLAALSSMDAEAASALDYARYRDTEENWAVRDGFGALVARWGADVPVRLSTPATRIALTPAGAKVETPDGSLAARAVLLTVSTNVLAADAIRFDPPLPEEKRRALAAVPIGDANRVALRFDRDVFGAPEIRQVNVATGDARTMLLQIRPFDRDLAIGYAGGAYAAELERAGPAAFADAALALLVQAFGSGIRAHVTGHVSSAWSTDPFIRGAYSAARPGGADRRADLSTPIDGRIFFAGEATSASFYSTAHGAFRSGYDGVSAVLKSLESRGFRAREA